jgi:hypothetical protein
MTELCSINGALWTMVLSCFDLMAAFVIFALMIRTTGHASWNGDPVGRWAMVRRYVYLLVVFDLFVRAVFHADPHLAAPWMEAVTGIVVVSALVFFLWTRAYGLVDQDHWLGLRGRGARQRSQY